ncbi:hypothetical protein ENBRE01_0884 [Enteropsectra breve]|nr:hypothetical protein ENBRE01_0884 [Enteropsectra breve]
MCDDSPFCDMAVIYKSKYYCPKTDQKTEDVASRPIATMYLKPEHIYDNKVINTSEPFETRKQFCTQCNSYFHREEVVSSLSASFNYLILEVIAAKDYSDFALEFNPSYLIINDSDGTRNELEYDVISILFVKIPRFGFIKWVYTKNEQQPLKFVNVAKNDIFYIMLKKYNGECSCDECSLVEPNN